jgi:uncharacterized protein YkwD
LTRLIRLAVTAALVLAVGGATAHAAPTPSDQLRPYDKHLLRYINHERAHNGLAPLKQSNRLYKIAHKWAAHMAKTENLEHNPNYGYGGPLVSKKCPHATIAGENVGAQAHTNAKDLFELYMDEPFHRANMLNPKYNKPKHPRYTQVGIATVRASDGSEWNVMDFANHCR